MTYSVYIVLRWHLTNQEMEHKSYVTCFVVKSLHMILEEKEKKIVYTYRRRVCAFLRWDLPLVGSYWWTSTPHYTLLHSSNTYFHFYYSLILRKCNNLMCFLLLLSTWIWIDVSSLVVNIYIFFYFNKTCYFDTFQTN